ncbi:MAG: ARMT1-like domain-containing protein [Phycisphaerae bacterium]|nr:ARMT1-like domain-containing protein [Phycisphaerae bacterium]
MRIYLDCMSCFARQALDAARLATDDEQIHEEVVRKVLRMASELDMNQSPPVIGQQIHRLVRNLVGSDDPYYKVKQQFNSLALKLYPSLRTQIINSRDPFETAIRFAIAGNIIDFGAKSYLTESEVRMAVNDSLSSYLDPEQVKSFKKAVNEAEKILYLADNAGEIVFDHLLIEQMPIDKITVVVKGSPVINDATMDDANLTGLSRIVEVIDNGSDGPGTILDNCSRDFMRHFEKADLIISKGQGNYETLSGVNKNIFFLLKAKCPVIAEDIGCEVGEMILHRSRQLQSI